MKIGFDAKRVFQNYTGLGNYSRTLLVNLSELYPTESYHLFAPKTQRNETTQPFFDEKKFQLHSTTHLWKDYWRTKGIVQDLKANHLDIYHGLSHELPIGIRKSGIKAVVTIHDLIFKIYPDYYPTAQRWVYDWKFKYACDNADLVIAISEQTKRDIITYYGTAEAKIKVVYQTCDARFQTPISAEAVLAAKKKYQLPNDYLLYVGSIIERKNLLRIVQAMLQLPKNFDIPLVAIGEGKAYKAEIEQFIKANGLKNRVILIPKIVYAHLPEIYAGASIFIYPSESEGFGIPIIEALFCGVPVISSDCSCLPEAAGEDSFLVNPKDVSQIANAIETILSDSFLQKKMIDKGKIYAEKNFSLEKATNDMYLQYQSIL